MDRCLTRWAIGPVLVDEIPLPLRQEQALFTGLEEFQSQLSLPEFLMAMGLAIRDCMWTFWSREYGTRIPRGDVTGVFIVFLDSSRC